ncbi:TIGR04150 pseudo-rSAM protein [Parabacteroides faecis]|uniref:Pseudo-rSAM protein n=1 Tax=Parabacteroides faecis TaxID=1217282 RepID=A0ABR6KVD4_9BACT|nr:TIGR04150 pseudo-rSAM protein [Parabacteroides faecis]MBB4624852.1 pseudo-rSAM protein [Parabacteroides faecis]GGK14688.1 hypothetical protein GCM10007084_42550 [Parabacteroides faecis]
MISKKSLTDYWFKIEPYVHISIVNNCALLYNTLDGAFIETDKIEVIELLNGILQKENCGVVLLTSERYQQQDIKRFINELLKKYMGDIIDVDLSKGKPVQILPYFNYSDTQKIFKKHSFASGKKILIYLSEITIYVDDSSDINSLISYLKSLPVSTTINIIGYLENIENYKILLSFLNQLSSLKNMIFPYTNIISLQPDFENDFLYSILVRFPVDMSQWNHSRQMLLDQTLPFEYIFEVSSSDDYQQAKVLVEEFSIEKYQLKPVYTGDNIDFFKEKVFLSKEDILSTSMSINDFFTNQSMNIYDFGKINIMPDGDIYANINHPVLGNIKTHSIYDVISKELEEGKSWLRVRNQQPCDTCLYQWHCPSPSNYEIEIGRPNLCHVQP